MSRSRTQIPSKENLTDKPRSSSISRLGNAAPKPKQKVDQEKASSKRKPSEPSTTLSSRDPIKKSSTSLKNEKHAVTDKQGREGLSKHLKPSTSKPSTISHSPRDRSSLKSQSDSNVSKKNLREQPNSVIQNKIPPVASKPKVKSSDQHKLAPPNAGKKKSVPEGPMRLAGNPSMPLKTSSSNTHQVDKSGKMMKEIDLKSKANGGGVEENRLNRERTRTRTLHPEESLLLTDFQSVAQQLPPDINPEVLAESSNDYEDDFEDYESDFEEAPSIEVTSEEETDEELSKSENQLEDAGDDDDKENYDYGDSSSSFSDLPSSKDAIHSLNGKQGIEEKKMDSGHYDLAEDRLLSGKALGAVLDKSRNLFERERQLNTSTKVVQKESETTGGSYEVKVINFAQAKKRQQERKASSKLKHRGEILLNMIRLDSVTFPLFDSAPVPYEIYMRSYGRSNTQQVSCQTNEDVMNEEMQTDEISTKNKWTQHPPAFVRPSDSLDYCLICAVSADPCDVEDMAVWKEGLKVDILELEKFVLNTGQLMLSVLEETASGTQGLLKSNKIDIGFSQGFITLGTESVPFLKSRRVTQLCFSPHQPNSLLSIHHSIKEGSHDEDLPAQMVKRCILCLWTLSQPSTPLKMLVSSSDVTACTFHPIRPHFLFAGLSDGILNMWDLTEQTAFQSKVSFEGGEWALRSPSYATVDCSGPRHSAAVVGVHVLDVDAGPPGEGRDLSPTQIWSLDEDGLCLVWTVLAVRAAGARDVGAAPWGRVRLLLNESFPLAPRLAAALDEDAARSLQFVALALDGADRGHLLAAANTGHVVHSLGGGARAHPALYSSDWDCLSPATCICPCPFGLPYFLVGCADGTVRLHSRHSARPLLSVAGPGGAVGSGPGVRDMQWSASRPCVFFVLDTESRLHVWDLAASDMFPILTVPFKGKTVTAMQLSPSRHSAKACPYLALGTSCGKLKVHLVKEDFASSSVQETSVELDKFKRYVAIL